jgi:hypothetical protein
LKSFQDSKIKTIELKFLEKTNENAVVDFLLTGVATDEETQNLNSVWSMCQGNN